MRVYLGGSKCFGLSKINKLRVFGSGMGKKKTITLSEDDIRGIKTGVFNL